MREKGGLAIVHVDHDAADMHRRQGNTDIVCGEGLNKLCTILQEQHPMPVQRLCVRAYTVCVGVHVQTLF